MLATLDIADDVLARAKDVARRRGLTVGEVLTEAARRGLEPPRDAPPAEARVQVRTKLVNGFVVFDVPDDGPKFDLEDVQRWLEEDDIEKYARFIPR